jgi:hypothetical protein
MLNFKSLSLSFSDVLNWNDYGVSKIFEALFLQKLSMGTRKREACRSESKTGSSTIFGKVKSFFHLNSIFRFSETPSSRYLNFRLSQSNSVLGTMSLEEYIIPSKIFSEIEMQKVPKFRSLNDTFLWS